jgi:cholesterol transport system auxiliary component
MRRTAWAGPLALVLALAGCALASPEPTMTSALLDQLPAEVQRRPASKATLLVFPPEARAAIDTTQMAYTLRPHHLAYFAQNQWAETPPQMLQPLVTRTMEATGAFAAVLTPPYAGTATLGLRTELTELVQDFSQDPPVLRLGLRVRVSEPASNRLLGTREFIVREPLGRKAPYAGVVAANAAVAQALREMAAFVLEQLP